MATLKKWDAFFNRTDLTTTDTFQVVGLDLSNPTPANQDQRSPITQLLRAGKNLSDLTSVSTAVTNLGATSASTANALVQRNASGIFNASGVNIDAASAPTLNIGATASFNIGLATASNNFFNGTVNGDACIRQGNTARQLLLGVGAGNAQFAVQNGGPQSNVSHKFAYAGTNRMPYLDASSILTGSANYTVNGTGGLTITQGFTAATGTFSGLGGVVIGGSTPSANVGATTQYGAATANNNFFNPSLTGDTCIRNTSTTNFVRIGVGGGDAQLIIGNTQFIVGVPITSSSVGANRMPFTNGSSNIIGSANYTVDGSGSLTIAQAFTAGSGVFGAGTNASAIVIATSTTQGILPPRMTTTQKNAISSPASGLIVYDTTLGKLCVHGAAAWETITSI